MNDEKKWKSGYWCGLLWGIGGGIILCKIFPQVKEYSSFFIFGFMVLGVLIEWRLRKILKMK